MNMIRNDFVPYCFERLNPDEMLSRSEAYYKLMDQRRTIREFAPDPIPDGVLENAIHTAATAPSGAHKQPWFFCVIKRLDIKRQIRQAAEKEEAENYQNRMSESWLEDLAPLGTDENKEYLEIAPALIVVFRENFRIDGGKRKKNYYVSESVGIASGMLIAALHNAGLSTLTHTPSPMGFLNAILGRPKNEAPILLMPVGYPRDETRIPDLERKPLTEIMKVY